MEPKPIICGGQGGPIPVNVTPDLRLCALGARGCVDLEDGELAGGSPGFLQRVRVAGG
jgi:hypothetical protein